MLEDKVYRRIGREKRDVVEESGKGRDVARNVLGRFIRVACIAFLMQPFRQVSNATIFGGFWLAAPTGIGSGISGSFLPPLGGPPGPSLGPLCGITSGMSSGRFAGRRGSSGRVIRSLRSSAPHNISLAEVSPCKDSCQNRDV